MMAVNGMLLVVVGLLILRKKILARLGMQTKKANVVYVMVLAGLLGLSYLYPTLFGPERWFYAGSLHELIDGKIRKDLGDHVATTGHFTLEKSGGGKWYETRYEMGLGLRQGGREYVMAGVVSCSPLKGCRFVTGPFFIDKRFVMGVAGGTDEKRLYDPRFIFGEKGGMRSKCCADFRVLRRLKERVGHVAGPVVDVTKIHGVGEGPTTHRPGYTYVRSCQADLLLRNGEHLGIRYDIWRRAPGEPEISFSRL